MSSTAHLPAAARRPVTVGMVVLVALLAFEALAVTTAMPAVAAALDGTAWYGLAFAAPLATGVVGMVVSGAWCDRSGATGPVAWGTGLFVAGLLLAGASGSMVLLAAARGLQGIGSGLVSVALYVLVGRLYPEHVRPRVFAWFSAAWVLPAIVGPGLAGLLVERLGWRWVFLAVPLAALPALALLRPALAADTRPPAGSTPPAGALRRTAYAVAAAAGVGLLSSAAQRTDLLGALLPLTGLAVLLAAGPRLLLPGTLTARRGRPTVVAVRGLVGGAFAGAEAFVPLLLVRERGLSVGVAGVVLTLAALAWFAGSALRGSRRMRLTPPVLLGLGSAALAVGTAAVSLALLDAVPVAVALAGWSVAGFGMGLAYPTLSLLVLELSAPSEQGHGSSALQVADSLGGAVALAVCGAVFAALEPSRSAYAACLALAVALAVLACAIAPRVAARTATDAASAVTPDPVP